MVAYPAVRGPESAIRTASRFGLCQPISDPFGPTRTTVWVNKSGALWSLPEIWIGSGGRGAGGDGVELTSDPGADGAYAIGETIRATLAFDAAVEVTGAPRLRLGLAMRTGTSGGPSNRRGSGAADLTFAYAAAEGDASGEGVAVLADLAGVDRLRYLGRQQAGVDCTGASGTLSF